MPVLHIFLFVTFFVVVKIVTLILDSVILLQQQNHYLFIYWETDLNSKVCTLLLLEKC